MSETPIQILNASRSFDGVPVIRAMSVSIKAGSIYGFLGRNGSGKTTTIRMLAASSGPMPGPSASRGTTLSIGAEERQRLGYMSERGWSTP